MTGGVLAMGILAAAAVADAAAAADAVPALPPSVCAGAELMRCRFVEYQPIGKDRHGNAVALVAFDEPGGAPGDSGCLPATYGLLHSNEQRLVSFEPLEMVDAPCAGDGSVSLAGPNRIVAEQRSESNWVYVTTQTWAVLPELKLIETSRLELYKGTGSSQLTTSVGGRTRVSWTLPDCSPQGAPAGGQLPESVEYRYTVVPVANESAAFRRSWRSARFPDEAVVVTSAGADGYVVSGRPGAPSDARMRVVALSARELVVEISDDRLIAGNPHRVTEDHLELWAGDRLPRYSDLCVRRDGVAAPDALGVPVGRAWQWRIRASDGAVFAAAGPAERPGMPSVERAALTPTGRNTVVRFRIALPAAFGTLAVVYSDTDDGRRQKRRIGTSKVVFGDPLSLGQLGVELPADQR